MRRGAGSHTAAGQDHARGTARRPWAQWRRAGRRGVPAASAVALAVALVAVLSLTLVTATSPQPGAEHRPGPAVHPLVRAPAVSSVAFGLGHGWLTDDRSDTVSRFAPDDGRVTGTAHVAGRPVAVVTGFGHVWVADMLTDTVEEFTPGLEPVRSVHVPAGPVALAVAARRVWVASVLAGTVATIDPVTGSVFGLHLPDGAVRLAAGRGAVWVTGTTDTLAEVRWSPTGNRWRWRVTRVGRGPLGVAVGPDAVWVADAVAGTVSRVDPATLTVTGSYRAGPDPVAVAVADGRAWVADGETGRLQRVGSGAVLPLGGGARQLLEVGRTLWAARGDPGAVLVVRPG